MAEISTDPSAISGTSRANSFFTNAGCVRETVMIGPRPPFAHADDVAAQPFTMDVLLARHLLHPWQLRFDRPEIDEHCLWVGALLDDSRDQVAFASRPGAKSCFVLSIAQPLQDHLLRGGRGHSAKPFGSVIPLATDSAILVGLRGPNRDVAGGSVKLNACDWAGLQPCGGRPSPGLVRSPRQRP